jgi:hypothetical protein
MHCCSYILNFIATTDADNALSDAAYKRVFHQAVAKATAIWNLPSRSTKAADAAFELV